MTDSDRKRRPIAGEDDDMPLTTEICYRLSRRRVLGRQVGDAGANAATFDEDSYHAWRRSELEGQFTKYFDPASLKGKDVLDFGSGHGDLSFLISHYEPKSITGLEILSERHQTSVERLNHEEAPVRPEFLLSKRTDVIERPDASADVLLCFDVLEHIMDWKTIIPEWHRVVRPNGRVFIWWVPWFHPYGHHVESLVPLPWVHALFSDRAIIGACEKVYDMPEFKPRIWDIDDEGNKKPNKWTNMKELPEVNRLRIGQFESFAKKQGFRIARRETHGFQSTGLLRASRFLTRLPLMREFFTSFMVYELERQP